MLYCIYCVYLATYIQWSMTGGAVLASISRGRVRIPNCTSEWYMYSQQLNIP